MSLPGSDFEIDEDANLIENEGGIDWAGVNEDRSTDALAPNDDSYSGGAKESTLCPNVGTGSIPPNKSDLENFGVYAEQVETVDGPLIFLHLFWSRVQDPSGTTQIDIEFNQSKEDCGNSVNMERTDGDLLVQYRLSNGGLVPNISVRFWEDGAWSDSMDLTQANLATGSINTSPIVDDGPDGLGLLDPRTFGEASINLTGVLEQNSEENNCVSFASALVKSRSSDSFESALKDFIGPMPVNITNCGSVVIRKEAAPAGDEEFGFTTDVQTVESPDPEDQFFTLAHEGSEVFTNVLFGTYRVTENDLNGYVLAAIDCSASKGVEPLNVDPAMRTVTFTIDDPNDELDCTFKNQKRGQITIEKISGEEAGEFSFESATLGGFSLNTATPETSSLTFADLEPNSYSVSEDVPDGWTLVSATCTDGSPPTNIILDPGESITCTFTNEPQRGAIKIVKTRDHAADGPDDSGHQGVRFDVTGGGLAAAVEVITDASGEACIQNLPLSAFVGDYTVTEQVPANYTPAGDVAKTVSVTEVNSCDDVEPVTFHNTPLTDITVSVDSLVDGGTASTIECLPGDFMATTGPSGDGSLTLEDLVPGQYICTINVI